MWRRIVIALVVGAISLCCNAAQESPAPHEADMSARRVALVIGNADYASAPFSRLPNALRDTAAMSETLHRLGFEVITYTNLNRARMNDAFRKFDQRLGRGGTGVIYFAGHGVQSGESTLLLPVDVTGSPASPLTQGIDLGELLAAMPVAHGNAFNLVILDTCLDNPYNAANVRATSLPARTVVAYATGLGKFASDGPRHGTYTAALIKAMTSSPGRDIEGMFRDVARSVSVATRGTQIPWIASSANGATFIASPLQARPTELTDAPVTWNSRGILPKDSNEQYELAFWESIKDSTYPSDYEAYLKAYPNGRFAALARARIDRLRAAAPKAQAQAPSASPSPSSAEKPHAAAAAPVASAPPVAKTAPPAEKAVQGGNGPPGPPVASAAPVAPILKPTAQAAAVAPAGGTGELKDCPACPALVALPAGNFSMGSNSDDPAERPVHHVSIGHPFAIGKYEVTIEQWNACVDASGCPRVDFEGDTSKLTPARNLSWDDAQTYVKWLAKTTGKGYRLPTEAEWEYAARGGTTTTFWWGDQMRKGTADCKECGEPYRADSPVNVGSFAANPFGLFDVNGSVWEWVGDCWHSSYKGAPPDGRVWDEAGCPARVIRGGSWRDGAAYMQSSTRFKYSASVRQSQNGMRVARDMK
jgi:formylglycine-generating enzyme required for sulfatase activity